MISMWKAIGNIHNQEKYYCPKREVKYIVSLLYLTMLSKIHEIKKKVMDGKGHKDAIYQL